MLQKNFVKFVEWTAVIGFANLYILGGEMLQNCHKIVQLLLEHRFRLVELTCGQTG